MSSDRLLSEVVKFFREQCYLFFTTDYAEAKMIEMLFNLKNKDTGKFLLGIRKEIGF
jgi:hypothetical protein